LLTFWATESIDVLTAPDASIDGPFTISEGEGLTLSSAETRTFGNPVSFEWDIDGDGVFGDSTVAEPILTWQQLCGFGLDDDGVYSIALRVTNDTEDPSSDGLFTDAFSTITILKTAPSIDLTGAATTGVGQEYAVTFSATDPGNDTIQNWVFDWDDGSAEQTFASDVSIATHDYLTTGTFTIAVTATDEDGSYVEGDASTAGYREEISVTVSPPAPDSITISTVGTETDLQIQEGQGVTLRATAPGDAQFSWDLDVNSDLFDDAAGAELILTWDQLKSFGINNGDAIYTLRVKAYYNDNSTDPEHYALGSAQLSVLNTAPTATFTNTGPINEGSAVTVSFADGSDPSDTDQPFEYSFAFGNDGAFSDKGGSASAAFTVPDSGPQIIRGRIYDKDGDFTEYATVVTVREVAPVLTVWGPGSVDEGSMYDLTLSATDPGNDAISKWVINWGDGSSSELPALSGSLSHAFNDDGSFDVIVTAEDEDGSYAATHNVIVNNLPPTIDPLTDEELQEGDGVTKTVTVADVGGGRVMLAASIGSVTENDDGTWDWSYRAADGPDDSQTVTITATDSDGDESSVQFNLTVNNVPPVVTLRGTGQQTEGGPGLVDVGALFTLAIDPQPDPGNDAITEYSIDWGDST